VFSQFTSMLDVIERELDRLGIRWLSITGKTQARQEIVDRFQAGEVPVLLVSLKAGGTGLNLTAADTVIHYDPWWNPAAQAQATDRAYRIGQQKPVFVYNLIAAGSVEERMLGLQQYKRRLAGAVVASGQGQGGSSPSLLGEAEVEHLLAPLDDD
jgi:SNF2 family DNA or RNA helicase